MDDLIFKQDVRDALEKICTEECPHKKQGVPEVCKSCILAGAFDAIEDLPLIDPYPVDPDDYY